MINYMIADLKRIYIRIPRGIALLLLFISEILFSIILKKAITQTVTATVFMTNFGQFTNTVVPVVLGLIELHAVYADDFKAKTMQIAIGIGIKRRHIILSKYLEMLILVIVDLVLYGLVITVAANAVGIPLQASHLSMLSSYLVFCGISVAVYAALTMILIFFMQSTGIAVLLYVLLSITVVSKILGLILSIGILESLSLERFLATSMITRFYTSQMLGSFHVRSFIGILIYIVGSYLITMILFKKRELEF